MIALCTRTRARCARVAPIAILAAALAARARADAPSPSWTPAAPVAPVARVAPVTPAAPVAAIAPIAPIAPSLALHDDDDARDLAALDRCSPSASYVRRWDVEQPLAWHCGQLADRPPPDLARLLAAAPPLDAETTARVRAIFRDGARKGRRAHVFGLLGDSLTLEPQFLTAFGAGAALPVVIPAAVRDALLVDERATVIDWFRGAHAYGALDPFRAPRAAKNGARARWALTREADADGAIARTPIERLVADLSPAFVVVLFGVNDADLFVEPLDRLAARFGGELRAIAAALEERGVVPILTTVPKHARAPSLPDCSARAADRSNARLAVQTTAASDVVAEIARERHLPLVDLRAALDPLLNRGISTDGVHPSFWPKRLGGGGVLDDRGLSCGYNVRALVTLRALSLVLRAVAAP